LIPRVNDTQSRYIVSMTLSLYVFSEFNLSSAWTLSISFTHVSCMKINFHGERVSNTLKYYPYDRLNTLKEWKKNSHMDKLRFGLGSRYQKKLPNQLSIIDLRGWSITVTMKKGSHKIKFVSSEEYWRRIERLLQLNR